MNKNKSNFIFKKLLTVFLSIGLIVSSFSPVILHAEGNEGENTQNGGVNGSEVTEVVEDTSDKTETEDPKTTNTEVVDNNIQEDESGEIESSETKETNEETPSSDSSTEVDDTNSNEGIDSNENTSVEATLEELINSLPTLEDYKAILESNDEDKYNEVASLLEQIEELASENDIDLSTYDKYVALFSNEDVDTLDDEFTVAWATSDGTSTGETTKKFVSYRESVYVYINAVFPSDSTDRAVYVLPNPSLYIREDGRHSENTGFKNSVVISTEDRSVDVSPAITVDANTIDKTYKTYNTGRKYTFNNSTTQQAFSIELRNSVGTFDDGGSGYGQDNNRLWSNGATNGTNCITVRLSYKDGNGKEVTEDKTLNVATFEKVTPQIDGNGYRSNYYTQAEPKMLLKNSTDTSSENMFYLQWKGDTNNSVSIKYTAYPIKNITLTMKVTHGLELDLSNTTSWVLDGDYVDNNDGTDTVKIKYQVGNKTENYLLPSYGGYHVLNYRPTIKFSSEIQNLDDSVANGKQFQLTLTDVDVIQYEDIQAYGALKDVTYHFDSENQTKAFCTCYYEIENLLYPYVTQFTAGENHTIANNHYGNSITDISWYNEDYKDNIGVVSILNYGLFGTRDLTDTTTVKMTFDNEYIGVTGVRLPMDREQVNSILNSEQTFNVSYKTNKNSSLQTKTLDNPTGYKNSNEDDNFSYIYVTNNDLGLANDEYITEIHYNLDQIKASYVSTTAGVLYGTTSRSAGRNAYNYGWVLGKILKYEKDTEYNCTIQLFKDEKCTNELTGEGVVTSKISGEKRVDLKIAGVTVNGKNAGTTLEIQSGDELTFSSKISYKDLMDGNSTKTNSYSSMVLGYTPVTNIYIRDLFGTGINNLNIQNTLTRNYLVEDGTPEKGVSVKLDHTEDESINNHNYKVNVYKISIDRSQLVNKDDCLVGHYNGAYNSNYYELTSDLGYEQYVYTDNLQYAKLTVSWKTKVDDEFERVGDDDLPVLLNDIFETAQTLYAEGDNSIDTVNSIEYQAHNNYSGTSSNSAGGLVIHIDEFDVNKNGDTEYTSSTAQTGTLQGDRYIVRAQSGTKLQMKQPTKRSGMIIENMFKETSEGDSAYRKYDESSKAETTVDLAADDSTLRLLVANFGTTDVSDLDLYVIIPKKGEKWGANTKLDEGPYNDQTNGFAFSVNLTSELSNPYENDATYPVVVTYAKIDPASTEDDITNQLSKFESYNAANASNYNIIHIHANDIQDGTSTETASQQLSRTKYFKATIEYGDKDYPSVTQYDTWRCVAKYREKGGGADNTTWHETDLFGLRAEAPTFKATTTVVDKNDTDTLVGTATSTVTPTYGNEYTTTVSVTNTNYELPSDKTSITVTVGGESITDFEYDPKTGKVTVPGAKVTGNIEITVPCTPKSLEADGKDIITNTTIEVANTDSNGTYDADNNGASNPIANINIVGEVRYKEQVTASVEIVNPNFTVDSDNIVVTVGDGDKAVTLDKDVDYTVKKASTLSLSKGTNINAILKVEKVDVKETWSIVITNTDKVTDTVHFTVPLKVSADVNKEADNGEVEGNTKDEVKANPNNPLETAEFTTIVYPDDGYSLPSDKAAFIATGTAKFANKDLTSDQFDYELKTDENGKTYALITVHEGLSLITTSKAHFDIKVVCVKNTTPVTPSTPSNTSDNTSTKKEETKVETTTNTNTTLSCEDYMRSKDWTWNEKSGKCVYRVSNTSSK